MTIQPRLLKGFRDFLPDDMRLRQHVLSVLQETFERYGYEPLETPVLEHADILTGKYGEEAEHLMYRFEDRGGRPVAMKYDLTVPACRVLAQYGHDLPLPFKRYQMQPVWRAENTQKGRFREFYQCDADTFGSSSPLVEAEFIQIGIEALVQLGFSSVVARLNNRKIIDGIVQYAGAAPDQFIDICTAVDKLDKIGMEGVSQELEKRGIAADTRKMILEVISLEPETALSDLKKRLAAQPTAQEGITELETILSYLAQSGMTDDHVRFDPTIIRGLSYYTGPIFEFAIADGGVGSVGGGGRFDNLVKTYAGSDIPAAGGSIGIERVIEIMQEKEMFDQSSGIEYLVTVRDPEDLAYATRVAQYLRQTGSSVMLYPDPQVKLDKQLRYANKKKIPKVVFTGTDEAKSESYLVKDMQTGSQKHERLVY